MWTSHVKNKILWCKGECREWPKLQWCNNLLAIFDSSGNGSKKEQSKLV